MNVKIPKELYEKIGEKKFEQLAIDTDSIRWNKFIEVDLTNYSVSRLNELLVLFQSYQEIRGTRRLITDITTWSKVIENKGTARPRTVQHFSSMLIKFLEEVPGHRIYKKDEGRNAWLCYYVESIEYHPPRLARDGEKTPPYVTVDLFHIELGGTQSKGISFYEEDCVGKPVGEALLQKGYGLETLELRAQYLKEKEKFDAYIDQIGKQFLVRGIGTTDLDGNDDDEDRWWRRSSKTIRLDKDDEPSRAVIDVFYETDKEQKDRTSYVNRWFWVRKKKDDDELDEEDLENEPRVEIPLHPMLACFDLRRHLRLRIHVEQLTEYIYDNTLGDKLVLPTDSRALVEILLAHKGGFKDIIVGKGGGAVILCAGPPGTGKTLTAEVYAEVASRPLYTVQCSQLGVNPEDLENELLKCFARSQRWNAILLLDEADVYVASRGKDLTQNAIVGVFLRTLEYYKGVLFLTTNRADLVDDAVASRCVAKIQYMAPSPEDQKKIWKILAKTAGVVIEDQTVDEIVKVYPTLTGRDVKNLLKLAFLVAKSRGDKINFKLIEFVKRFKPTETERIDIVRQHE